MTPKAADQPGAVFRPVPRAEQERALAFLAENALQTPRWLLDVDLLRRIQPVGAVERMRALQVAVLNEILDPRRMQRLVEAEAIDGSAYPLPDYLADLRAAVWSELDSTSPTIDPFRRNLQRGAVERLSALVSENERPLPEAVWFLAVDLSQSDIRAAARGELRRIQESARRAEGQDAATPDHLADVIARIEAVLDPR